MSAPAVAAAGPAAGESAAAPAKPATTRVTILTGRRMTDLVLPSAVTMETYIDDTVAVLAQQLEDAPADVLSGFDFSAQGMWAFARPGSPPLKLDQSLDDAGVVDGSLLTLVAVSRTERYRPLVEDVIDAIAVLDESPEFDRTALNRFVAVAIPAVTTAMTVMAADAALDSWWDPTLSPLWAAGVGIVGILLLVASFLAKRMYKVLGLAESLLIASYPLIVFAVALAIPPPAGDQSLGAPQLAAGTAAVLVLTLVTRGGPYKRAWLASFIVISTIAVTAAAVAYGYGWGHWVPAGAIAFGLFIVTNAAKLTVAVARIALPPIPAPGESVENEELLDPIAGIDTAEETQTWQAIIESVPKSAARLTERSKLAKQLLIGYLTSATLILAFGAITVVVRGHFFVHTLIIALLVTAVCGFRSRLYAERWCAWALLSATVAIPTGVAVKLSSWFPESAWLILSIYFAVAVVAVVVVGSTARASRRMSPVMKRVLELVDGAMIAAIIPLLLWITSIYDMVRNLQF